MEEENPEIKLVKHLKQSKNPVDWVTASSIERLSEVEKELDEQQKYFEEEIDRITKHFYELIDIHEKCFDAIIERIEKLEVKK